MREYARGRATVRARNWSALGGLGACHLCTEEKGARAMWGSARKATGYAHTESEERPVHIEKGSRAY